MITDTLVVMAFQHFPFRRFASTAPRSGLRRGAQLLATTVAVVGMGMTAGSAAPENVPNPSDLPTYPESGTWIALRGTAINYAGTPKQWMRMPPLFTSAYNRNTTLLQDRQCRPGGRLYPYASLIKRSAAVHLQSSANAKKPYGLIGPIVVRTVAFGSIPIEAEVQLQQVRDSVGKTVGLEFKSAESVFCPGLGPFPDGTTDHIKDIGMRGDLNVAIVGLRVDGVNLKLRETCRTAKPAAIAVTAPDYYRVTRGFDRDFYIETGPGATPLPPDQVPSAENLLTTPTFQPVKGGLLTGKVTISAFSGCLTSGGEDISRLLTATVSGDDNHVVVRAEGLEPDDTLFPPGTPLPPLPFPTTAP